MERKRGERYSQKFRCRAIERMNACENIVRLSREQDVHRRLPYKWRDDQGLFDAQSEDDAVLQNSREFRLRREIGNPPREGTVCP